MTNKTTKRDYYTIVKAMVDADALSLITNENGAVVAGENAYRDVTAEMISDFVTHEIKLLNKKHASGKKTKSQEANEEIKNQIVAKLAETGEKMRVADIRVAIGVDSHQKVTSLVTQLSKEGRIVREEVKGVAYFYVSDVE